MLCEDANNSSTNSTNSIFQRSIIHRSHIIKPQLIIANFSGDIIIWNALNSIELFENLIINDSSLTAIKKLIYIKFYVKKLTIVIDIKFTIK